MVRLHEPYDSDKRNPKRQNQVRQPVPRAELTDIGPNHIHHDSWVLTTMQRERHNVSDNRCASAGISLRANVVECERLAPQVPKRFLRRYRLPKGNPTGPARPLELLRVETSEDQWRIYRDLVLELDVVLPQLPA